MQVNFCIPPPIPPPTTPNNSQLIAHNGKSVNHKPRPVPLQDIHEVIRRSRPLGLLGGSHCLSCAFPRVPHFGITRKNNDGDDTFSIQGYSTSMVNGAAGGSCSTHVLTARGPCCRTRIPNDARSWARNHISSSAPAYVSACLQVCASACVGLSLYLSLCLCIL
jgi:hypothetical protein